MNKKIEHKFDSLNLQDYYGNLSKKNKGLFLKYLVVAYDMNYSTIRRKLTGVDGFFLSTVERIACNEAIKNEEKWKN